MNVKDYLMGTLSEDSKTKYVITHNKKSTSDLINYAIKYTVMWDEALSLENRRVLSAIYNGEINLIDNIPITNNNSILESFISMWKSEGYTPSYLNSKKITHIKRARELSKNYIGLKEAKELVEEAMDLYEKEYMANPKCS